MTNPTTNPERIYVVEKHYDDGTPHPSHTLLCICKDSDTATQICLYLNQKRERYVTYDFTEVVVAESLSDFALLVEKGEI